MYEYTRFPTSNKGIIVISPVYQRIIIGTPIPELNNTEFQHYYLGKQKETDKASILGFGVSLNHSNENKFFRINEYNWNKHHLGFEKIDSYLKNPNIAKQILEEAKKELNNQETLNKCCNPWIHLLDKNTILEDIKSLEDELNRLEEVPVYVSNNY